MENTEVKIAEKIFYKNEDLIYSMIEKFDNNQVVDKSLVYCFVKAFYIYAAKLHIEKKKSNLDFEKLYAEYKENLKNYYRTNNPNIENDILDQILNFFDNSFGLIGTVELEDVEEPYGFRHYTINVFELLRIILEKKSKGIIRENIFDEYIRTIIAQIDEISGIIT